ncbi:MCIN protein, partial [Crypturellus soui]|nr:MCIN protein [Crypturellus soui]
PSPGYFVLSQGFCSQDESDFDFQEFKDAVDDFVSGKYVFPYVSPEYTSALMPPPLDSDDFDFPLGEDVVVSPCALEPESRAAPTPSPQGLPALELCWRDVAGQHEKALGDALEQNSQLQETLTRRQEELTSLRKSNVQLKELASQARQLATVLDKLLQPQGPDGAALPPSPPPPPPPHPAWAPAAAGSGEAAAVDTMLRDVSQRCRAALRSLGGGAEPKRPRRGPERLGRVTEAAEAAGGCLRAALGQAGRIRTLAFPQGSAFSLRMAGGGYRFRWVPH